MTGIRLGPGGFTVDPSLDAPRRAVAKSRRRTARPITEAAVKTAVMRKLAVLGAYAISKHQTSLGKRGTPDVLACLEGRFLALEIKREGNVPTPEQLGEMRRWQQAGALAGWVQSVEDLDELLSHLADAGWRNDFKSPGDGRSADDPW